MAVINNIVTSEVTTKNIYDIILRKLMNVLFYSKKNRVL